MKKLWKKYLFCLLSVTIFLWLFAFDTLHAATPAIDLDSWGVVTYSTNNGTGLSCWVKVIDHDGVSSDGSSHIVTVSHDGDTEPLSFVRTESTTSGYYEAYFGLGSAGCSSEPTVNNSFNVFASQFQGGETVGSGTAHWIRMSVGYGSEAEARNDQPNIVSTVTMNGVALPINGNTVVEYNSGAAIWEINSYHCTGTLVPGNYTIVGRTYRNGVEFGSANFVLRAISLPGDYTFTVTDLDGNVGTAVDILVVDPLEPPDEDSFTPSLKNPVQEYITATFDNVYVNGLPYEDFNSYGTIADLDNNKWGWCGCNESGGTSIESGTLEFAISNAVGRGSCNLIFADPASVNSIQADITVNSVSSMGPHEAAMRGVFFSNGNRDVSAKIAVKGDRVNYYVGEEWINNQGTYSWDTLATGDLMMVITGQTVTASVSWDGTSFHFDANGNTADYTYTGEIYPTIFDNSKELRARINLVTDTTPTFTWDPVPGATRYRVRIYNYDNSRTIWRGNSGNETFYTVPPGVLQPNSYYKYRIEAWDEHNPFDIDNISKSPASDSENYRFYTGEQESVDPFIDFDSSGVSAWNNELQEPFLSFWIEVHDAQGVPNNIKSVKVALPSGAQEVLYYDADWFPTATSGIYHSDSFLPIETGTYTFTVEDREGHIYSTTEDLTPNPIGYPAEASLTPDHNTVIGDTAVNFDWEDVSGAAFYRVEIYDTDFNRLHTFNTTDSQYSLPAGFLQEDTLYRYRIRTRREFFDQNVDNGSTSPFDHFVMPNILTTPVTGGFSAPTLDLDSWGVYTMHIDKTGNGDYTFYLVFEVKVVDDDGVPANIQSVRVTYPDGITMRDLHYTEEINSTQARYLGLEVYDDYSLIPTGTYSFEVTDFDGRSSGIATDDLEVDILPLPTNCTPEQDSTVLTTTPTIDWDDVPGASSYRVRIYEGLSDTLHWSDYLTESIYTIPTGILRQGQTYHYRVYAHREAAPDVDVDNASIDQLYSSERHHFTTLPNEITTYYSLPGGSGEVTDYRLFTVPVELQTGSALKAQMEDVLGTYDNTQWRVFAWDPTSSYIEMDEPAFASLRVPLGMAFWIISRGTDTISFKGQSAPATDYLVIYLSPGWNMFGLPWTDARIDLDKIAVSDGVYTYWITSGNNGLTQQYIWDYTGTGPYSGYEKLVSGSVLQSGKGYLIYVDADAAVTLLIPKDNSGGYFSVSSSMRYRALTTSDKEPPPPPREGLSYGSGSSGGKAGSGGSGCFIATAAYGSRFHSYVKTLRSFRDVYLLNNAPGRKLVALYYKYSPPIAEMIANNAPLKYLARLILLPLIGFSACMLYANPMTNLLLLVTLLVVVTRIIWWKPHQSPKHTNR